MKIWRTDIVLKRHGLLELGLMKLNTTIITILNLMKVPVISHNWSGQEQQKLVADTNIVVRFMVTISSVTIMNPVIGTIQMIYLIITDSTSMNQSTQQP